MRFWFALTIDLNDGTKRYDHRAVTASSEQVARKLALRRCRQYVVRRGWDWSQINITDSI